MAKPDVAAEPEAPLGAGMGTAPGAPVEPGSARASERSDAARTIAVPSAEPAAASGITDGREGRL